MNYYERHLGDYARDTAHLSLIEHGVYTLLLDRYYATELPIPADQAHRLARARTPAERAAVAAVLSEFFQLDGDNYRNRRADGEIEKARARIAVAQENGKRGGRPKKTQRVSSGLLPGSENKTQTKAHQTPDTITPESKAGAAPAQSATACGLACKAMRAAGCIQANPSHPDLIAAVDEGVTPEELADAVTEAIAAGKVKPFGWAIATARGRHAEGAKPVSTGHARASLAPSRQISALAALTGAVHEQTDATAAVVHGGDTQFPGHAVRPEPRRLSGG